MRWQSEPRWVKAERRKEALQKWHRYFAWKPVRLFGENTVVWLEYVQRQGLPLKRGRWHWYYEDFRDEE